LRVFDLSLRILGAVLSALMGVGSALLEATATPGFWLYPVAGAIVGNVFLTWFALYTVDRPWAPWVPAAAWAAVMLAMIGGTSEGDQIANSFTGLATLFAGGLTFVVANTLLSRPGGRPLPGESHSTPA
jgi:hypothetical protein